MRVSFPVGLRLVGAERSLYWWLKPRALEACLKILVTGADGFIGSHLVEVLLARGHEVSAVCQYNSFNTHGWLDSLTMKNRGEVNVFAGDIRDSGFVRQAIAGHDRVAHLAALIAIPYSYVAPRSYFETNSLGTLNVLEASRAEGVDRVVHTSTSEVYGTAQYVPIDEKHPLVGQSPYSASKIAADQLAYSFWASFDVPVTTIRPFNTYGPRQSQRAFIPSLMIQLLTGGGSLQLGSLAPTRDLTFVEDTARGFAHALESNLGVGETFNMGSGFEVSMADVVAMTMEIAGQERDVVLDEDRIRPIASEVDRLWSNSAKMTEVFDWQPEWGGREGLYRGLESTFAWLRENHENFGYDAAKYVL